MITDLGPDMDSTKKELENIDKEKGGLITPVNKMVDELDVTRTVIFL